VTSTIVNVLLAISPSVRQRTKNSLSSKDQARNPRPRGNAGLGKTLIEGVGNYLIAARPQVGNSVIVSNPGQLNYLATAPVSPVHNPPAAHGRTQFADPGTAALSTWLNRRNPLIKQARPSRPGALAVEDRLPGQPPAATTASPEERTISNPSGPAGPAR
jgi:hypothetical protein